MLHAAVLAETVRRPVPFDTVRMALIYFCALALIGAGPFLPGVAW